MAFVREGREGGVHRLAVVFSQGRSRSLPHVLHRALYRDLCQMLILMHLAGFVALVPYIDRHFGNTISRAWDCWGAAMPGRDHRPMGRAIAER